MTTQPGRVLRVIRQTVVWLLCCVVVAEITLQILHLLVKPGSRLNPENWRENVMRVVTLGDSNTYGLYLEQQDSYPSRFEVLWNQAHPERPVQVINLGYPGTTSSTILQNLPGILEKFKPDVVLLLVGFNDRWTPDQVNISAHSSAPAVGENVGITFSKWVQAHSRLYRLYYMFARRDYDPGKLTYGSPRQTPGSATFSPDELDYLAKKAGMAREELLALSQSADLQHHPKYPILQEALKEVMKNRKPAGKKLTPEEDIQMRSIQYDGLRLTLGRPTVFRAPETLDLLEPNIVRIADLLEKSHTRLLLISYGSSWGWYQEVNREIQKIVDQHHLPFVDSTSRLFKLCQETSPCEQYFFADFHPNAEGYRVIAEEVVNGLPSRL